MRRFLIVACALAAIASPAAAQSGSLFRITESTFNNGGDPAAGMFASSSLFRITLDAVGDGLGQPAAGSLFRIDSGFVSFYPPPGEVAGLVFTDDRTLVWLPDRSIGRYQVYRDPVTTLGAGGTGACFATGLALETATDLATPPSGTAWFYLVTARNTLGEEGTKGYRSDGSERPNPAACP